MPRLLFGSVIRLLLVASCAGLAGLHAAPNILVLDSYHPGYTWSDGEVQGVLRVLSRAYPGAIPSIEFLDTNRNPDPTHTELIFNFVVKKYSTRKFDLVVTLDDPALQVALHHRQELGASTPIVFGGVNNYEPKIIAGEDNITGVCEAFDFVGNIDLILRLRPETKVIHVISDTAASTQETRMAFRRATQRYKHRVEFHFITDWTAASLLQQLADLPPNDSVLMIGNARDASGQLVSENERFLRGESANSTAPIFMVSQPYLPISEGYDWTHAVWYGMGGRMLEGDVHGEAVGSLAMRVLAGEKAGNIPVVLISPTRCAFDYPQLLRHHIDLSRLPPDAEFFGRPVSFYEHYKGRIIVTLSAIGVLIATILLLAANILKRKKAEGASRAAMDRFELMARATNDAVWDLDLKTGAMWWNDGYRSLLGLSPSEPASRGAWAESIHPEERDSIMERLLSDSSESAALNTTELRVIRSDNSVREVLLRVYFLHNSAGKRVRAIGTILDLTQRKAAERQLHLLATAVMQASEIVVVLDRQGCVEYANPAFARSCGISLEAALRRPLNLFRDPKNCSIDFAQIERVILERGRWTERLILARPDSSSVQIQATISPLHQAGGVNSGYIMMGLDVSNEVRLEEQVRLAQKMDAIGTLAGGVAHDFNNMLQVISGNVSLALEDGSTFEQVRENLHYIREAANHAGQLTRQLLLFGRRQTPQAENVDLHEITEDLMQLLTRVIGENYRITQKASTDLWNVHADKSQVEQVLMNLCVNARDSMPNGGQLDITLGNINFDATFSAQNPWARPGDFVRLRIADTGCGMDTATLGRIFEPFFTTKPKNKGTGLGLSVVFGIVEQHRGFLHVETTIGKGSRFEVYFPRSNTDRITPAESPSFSPEKGSGTILLIEDEKSVQKVILRILENAGYEVFCADDGVEGVALGIRYLQRLSLIVLDAVMPNLNGIEVYKRLSPLRPELPFLFCSGYSTDALPSNFSSLQNVALLQKPFGVEKLLQEVRTHFSR